MRRALVVGAAGMLGQRLCERLREAANVIGLSRRTGFDLTRADALSDLPNDFDLVFNCAAAFEGESLENLVAVNALGAQRLAQHALRNGAYFVHASTISTLSVPGDAYFGPYAMTKRLGDELVTYTASRERKPAAVLRFPQLYDSDGACRHTQPMLFRLIEQIREQGCAILYGDNDPLRNYLHIDDAVTIMLKLAEHRLSGCWAATHPESVSMTQLVARIAAQLDKQAEIRRLPDKPRLPEIAIPDSAAFYEQLGWSPQVGLDQGLGRLIRGR